METKDELYDYIEHLVSHLKYQKYDPTGEESYSLWVFDYENEVLDECIKQIINQSPNDSIPALQCITIEADDIANGNFPEKLPSINNANPNFASISESHDVIEKAGYGILYLRNITKNNYEQFPRNFTWSLSKHHSLRGKLLSHHWLIIGGIPKAGFCIDLAGRHQVIQKEDFVDEEKN